MPLMVRYIVPNLLPTLRIVFIFSLVSNILTESTLSFLGLGLPINEVSWGSMLNEGRKNLSAWWLTVFPGLALFLVVYTLNLMSEEHQ
jgi:peptide/nickel transport system permease protein